MLVSLTIIYHKLLQWTSSIHLELTSENTLLTNQQKLQTTYAMCLPLELPLLTSTASTNSVYRVSL